MREENDKTGAGGPRGIRCRICTGCGLCPGVSAATNAESGLHVLSEGALADDGRFPLKGKKRLVTVDVGTTTVAMLLYGADGAVADRYVCVNPQTAWGADVLSRVRAAEDPSAAQNMRQEILNALGRGMERFRKKLSSGETMFFTAAANTVMTYLLMGWDPAELGRAPFHASRLEGVRTEIAGVPGYILPGLSAFVGGDIVAGIHACGMCQSGLTLLLDLGTNGEMVLGDRKERIACATAAGPAFEGGPNRGVWGADMISLLARLRDEEILDETGVLKDPYFETGIRIGNVLVTQESIRAVQLAKGAIAAGIGILIRRLGVSVREIKRVVLAGGFGYYLNPQAAARIGLFPAELADRAVAGGNTALAGALLAGRQILASGGTETLNRTFQEGVLRTKVLNLAHEEGFEETYVECLSLERFWLKETAEET